MERSIVTVSLNTWLLVKPIKQKYIKKGPHLSPNTQTGGNSDVIK